MLPLTPNGKLDRKALPAPGLDAYVSRAYEAPLGNVEATLARLWSELLGVERVGRHDNFFELGGHSLLAVQLVSRIHRDIKIDLPLSQLFINPTLKELANIVAASFYTAADKILSTIKETGLERPLFVVHTIDGDVGYAVELAKWIHEDVPIFGLSALGFAPGEEPLRDISAMATRYIREMRRVQPHGPYRLTAWSGGGIVAYEMAHQLMAAGETVGFLGLIDTLFRVSQLSDGQRKWLGDGEHSIAAREKAFLLALLELTQQLPHDELAILGSQSDIESILRVVSANFGMAAETSMDIDAHKRSNAVSCAFMEAMRDYVVQPILMDVHLFAATQTLQGAPDLGWRDTLSERLHVIQIEGDHGSILQTPAVVELGQCISSGLRKLSNISRTNTKAE